MLNNWQMSMLWVCSLKFSAGQYKNARKSDMTLCIFASLENWGGTKFWKHYQRSWQFLGVISMLAFWIVMAAKTVSSEIVFYEVQLCFCVVKVRCILKIQNSIFSTNYVHSKVVETIKVFFSQSLTGMRLYKLWRI